MDHKGDEVKEYLHQKDQCVKSSMKKRLLFRRDMGINKNRVLEMSL